MLKHYWQIAIRIIRNKSNYSIINIGGLAVSIAAFTLIYLFIYDELSYDRFHSNYKHIYRINRLYSNGQISENASTCSFPLGPAIVEEYPDWIEAGVRFFNLQKPYVYFSFEDSSGKKIGFNEGRFFFVDSSLFQVFDFSFIHGSQESAFDKPNSIIISSRIAHKYFGTDSVEGKMLRFEDEVEFLISGVFEDFPNQSHVHPELLSPMEAYRNLRGGNMPSTWIWNPCWTYLLLKSGIDPGQLEKSLSDFRDTHYYDFSDEDIQLYLMPLKDIHLRSHLAYEIKENSDIKYIYILVFIGLVVLSLACINFTNLSTAGYAERIKEIGVKKVFGSNKIQLATQFIAEAVIMSLIATIVSIAIVEMVLPHFNNLSGKSIDGGILFRIENQVIFISIALFVGLLSGSYPALFLSSFSPVGVFKGRPDLMARGGSVRQVLVTVQFAASIVLIIGTVVIFEQIRFMNQTSLGFNRENILTLSVVPSVLDKLDAFSEELIKHPDIDKVSTTEDLPGLNHNTHGFVVRGSFENREMFFPCLHIDYDFVEIMGIEMAEGRSFSRNFLNDPTSSVMVNEFMVKNLGWTNEEAIGKRLDSGFGDQQEIVGVFKDFYPMGLKTPISNFILDILPIKTAKDLYTRYIVIGLQGEYSENVREYIKKVWNMFEKDRPCDVNEFSGLLSQKYQAEKRFGKFSLSLSLLAVFIASIGLIGLTSYMAERRTREIGIRRVLGSSTTKLVGLLSSRFIVLLIIANIIAWPVAYFWMSSWLQNYVERISVSIYAFVISALFTIGITLLIAAYRAVRVSRINPANTLRYE